MSLSPPSPREPVHHRRIDCRGYRRADGLWDIEGHLTDTKSYPFTNSFRGEVAPGEPIHDMWLRLTVDDEFTVIRAEAATDAGAIRGLPRDHAGIRQARRPDHRPRLAAGRAGAARRRAGMHASGRAARPAGHDGVPDHPGVARQAPPAGRNRSAARPPRQLSRARPRWRGRAPTLPPLVYGACTRARRLTFSGARQPHPGLAP